MPWQSPISPGVSWYEDSVAERPVYPSMDGSTEVDIAIIGGGFTGLQAAFNLASRGVRTVLIEANRFGDGASGRNGGQLGTGQRWWPEEVEDTLGYERSKALFDLAENAKAHLLGFAATHQIEIDYIAGHMSVSHKKSLEQEYRDNPGIAESRYNYPHSYFMEKDEAQERLGSSFYQFGVRDTGTGHIQPMKLLVGLARAAAAAGAAIYEQTRALKIEKIGSKVSIRTAQGTITADRALIACNGHIAGLEPITDAHIMPIRSFIGATVPLDAHPSVLPASESVADSRFVVRYFRKSKDGRLLFGGREAYTSDSPRDISSHIRRQISEIYPNLASVEMTHAWGGSVGITLPRRPFVREVMPGVTSIGGYSGHGVMLSNYCGKLYADLVTGQKTDLELFRDFNVPAFPGGSRFRSPLLLLALTWYALRDKF